MDKNVDLYQGTRRVIKNEKIRYFQPKVLVMFGNILASLDFVVSYATKN